MQMNVKITFKHARTIKVLSLFVNSNHMTIIVNKKKKQKENQPTYEKLYQVHNKHNRTY